MEKTTAAAAIAASAAGASRQVEPSTANTACHLEGASYAAVVSGNTGRSGSTAANRAADELEVVLQPLGMDGRSAWAPGVLHAARETRETPTTTLLARGPPAPVREDQPVPMEVTADAAPHVATMTPPMTPIEQYPELNIQAGYRIRLPDDGNFCYYCGQTGHTRSACKGTRVLFCASCGWWGVRTDQCPCNPPKLESRVAAKTPKTDKTTVSTLQSKSVRFDDEKPGPSRRPTTAEGKRKDVKTLTKAPKGEAASPRKRETERSRRKARKQAACERPDSKRKAAANLPPVASLNLPPVFIKVTRETCRECGMKHTRSTSCKSPRLLFCLRCGLCGVSTSSCKCGKKHKK